MPRVSMFAAKPYPLPYKYEYILACKTVCLNIHTVIRMTVCM